jgi:hypothetical protein
MISIIISFGNAHTWNGYHLLQIWSAAGVRNFIRLSITLVTNELSAIASSMQKLQE